MKLLETQEQFETLWFEKPGASDGHRPKDKAWCVFFTASWCGPCKKLDLEQLTIVANSIGLPFWKCDYTVNEYTPGYCNVRKFPTFVVFRPGQIVAVKSSNDTEDVAAWIQTFAN